VGHRPALSVLQDRPCLLRQGRFLFLPWIGGGDRTGGIGKVCLAVLWRAQFHPGQGTRWNASLQFRSWRARFHPGLCHTAAASRCTPCAVAIPHGAFEFAKRLECASLLMLWMVQRTERVGTGLYGLVWGGRFRKGGTSHWLVARSGPSAGAGGSRRRGSTAGTRIPKRSAVVAIVAG